MQRCEYFNFEQGTAEWDNIRLGMITGSTFHNLMMKKSSVGRSSLIYSLAAERILKKRCECEFTGNQDTERGHEVEPIAIEYYETTRSVTVEHTGFAKLDDMVGCSPDGFISHEYKLIEVKSPRQKEYLKTVIKGVDGLSKKYLDQIQFNMYVMGLAECDLLFSCVDFKDHPVHVFNIKADEDMHELIEMNIESAKTEINDIIYKFGVIS